MNYKKNVSVIFIVLMMIGTIGGLLGKSKFSKNYDKIQGDYELYYPLRTKNIYYFSFYVDKGRVFAKQEGVADQEELFLIESSPLTWKSNTDGNIYRFLINDSGKVDKIIVKTKKTDVNGIKLPARIYNKNNQPEIEEKYSVIAMKDDFDQMVRIMKYLHPAMYDYTPEKEFERFIKKSRKKIVKPMKINEFFAIAAPVISRLGCLHSSIRPPRFYTSFKEARYFPMEVQLIKDKLYIINSLNKNSSFLNGTEITSINGIPIEKIKEQIFNFLSSDWHNIQYKAYAMSAAFRYYYYYLYRSIEKFKVNYKTQNNHKTETIEISGLTRKTINDEYEKLPMHPIYSSKAYSLTFLKKNQIALMSIKHFNFYKKSQEKEFYKFIDESFLEIKNKKIKNLLIDIRGNGGGSPFPSSYLLSYLIDKPFQYFITNRPNAYSKFYKLQSPQSNLFKGKVITLIDNGNLSTSGHFVSLIKHHNIGKLAGIITGSNFSCTHGESNFSLRNTGMYMRMSRERFSTPAKGLKIDEGIAPDYKIELTLKDLLDVRDIQLEKAIDLFEK